MGQPVPGLIEHLAMMDVHPFQMRQPARQLGIGQRREKFVLPRRGGGDTDTAMLTSNATRAARSP